MGLAWNPFGVLSVATMLLGWAMAAVIWATRRDRPQNQLLALALLVGASANGFYFGLRTLAPDAPLAYAMLAVGMALLLFMPAPYLLFLATLDAPLARPLASRAGQAAVVALVLVPAALWLADPRLFIGSFVWSDEVAAWQFEAGPLLQIPLAVLGAAQVYGLVVAVSAYRRARTTIERRRARAYAVAFGVRDVLGVAFIGAFGFLGGLGRPAGRVLFELGIPVADTLFGAMLAYAILRTQLFDIDLRIKTTLRRSIVGGVFVAAFFLAEQAAQLVLQARVHGTVAGLAGAALVAVALAPVQRFAGRLSQAAMPGVAPTGAYVTARKADVYREAVEAVMVDGVVTPKERAMLDRLRDKLALTAHEAHAVEFDVARVPAAPSPGPSPAAA